MARRRWVVGLGGLLVLSALTSCGSRLSTEEIRAQSGTVGADRAAAAGDAGLSVGDGDTTATGDGAEAPTDAATASGKSGAGRAGPAAAKAATAGNKAPIVVGFVGWLSGTGGETIAGVRDAWVVWSRAVNARGGINGHKVQLLVGDHGGNESRAVAIARDFVENKGAVVLTTGSGGPAVAQYALQKRVPVVGSVMTGDVWNDKNAMAFPPYGAGEATAWGSVRLMKRTGRTKLASIYCAESPDCDYGNQRIKHYAQEEGIQVVSEIRYSVTAPDYTAECIQMRTAGAEIVYPLGDGGSMIRMAKACARQNFHPIWVSPTMDDNVTRLPEFEGAIAVSSVFPWFLRSASPAIDEYVAAFQKYAPARLARGSLFVPEGWVSAKLLEKAAEKVGDKPTSENILEGLWSMNGETLGGLLPGRMARTFRRDQPTPESYCVFDTRLTGGRWTAPSGLEPICR